MPDLALFNPDNDMALADFTPGFTPPRRIQLMMSELTDFARVWAGAGIRPWGWSPAVCHRLRLMGVAPEQLPSRERLERLRALSSRQTAVTLLPRLRADLAGHPLTGLSRMCRSEREVREAVAEWGRVIMKQPWSSSGKGLLLDPTNTGWVRRTLRAQGGVVVEPLYERTADAAMEFVSDGRGRVRYAGLSLFTTTPAGAYRGNLIAPEAEKQAWLDRHIPAATTRAVRQWLEANLSATVGDAYEGPLGVDMMVVAGGLLHPLVEVNLRMTMGMAAHMLAQKKPAQRGELILEYAPGEPLPEGAELLAGGAHFRVYILR